MPPSMSDSTSLPIDRLIGGKSHSTSSGRLNHHRPEFEATGSQMRTCPFCKLLKSDKYYAEDGELGSIDRYQIRIAALP